MTDRELLEAAAKAAGLCLEWDGHPDKWQPMYYDGKTYHGWNPLTDDGDALRLAVKLRMGISLPVHKTIKADVVVFTDSSVNVREEGNDPYAATRRAIVRAAACIGESMK